MSDKEFIKKRVNKAKNFFDHFPLFAKYLITMTSLILVSYLVLATSLFIFFSNKWTVDKQKLLTENVRDNAKYCERILEDVKTEEELNGAMLLICNNLGVTSNAIDADVYVCNPHGKVILCKENFTYGFIDGDRCVLHKGYKIPDEIMEEVKNGGYFSEDKIPNLYVHRTFFAGAPIINNGQFVGAVFAADPVGHSFKGFALNILKMYLISAVFAVALSFIVVYALTAKLTNPLRQMSSATKAYAEGDFSKRIAVKGNDELAGLCDSFNKMASALSTLESSRRSFIANVSHELKTPMTTIGGFIDGILDGTIPEEKHEEYLQIVSNEVQRLSRLVIAMLNLSKIEAGELELKLRDVDLNSVVIDSLLNFEQVIDKNNINIEGLSDLQNYKVRADEDMIHQVIYNLVDNAVKFTPVNGTISVFTGEESENRVFVSIQNTGDGVSSEEISKIFERFYKVDKSRSYDAKSAGLGLYLCKTIVEMHGGSIYAESVKGEYTRFTIVLDKAQ